MPTIRYRGTRDDFRGELARLVACLAGDESSPRIESVKRKMAEALLGKIHEAYEIKKRGGTDEFGIEWPELAPSTIRRKGHAIIMVEEGELLESLRPGSGHADQILRLGPGWLEVGSDRSTPGGTPLITIHARGGPHLPVRRVLPPEGAELPAAWVEAMGTVLSEELASDSFWREFLAGRAA
jgi:hypothetical protein